MKRWVWHDDGSCCGQFHLRCDENGTHVDICARPLGHQGNHRTDGQEWTDEDADRDNADYCERVLS